MADATTVAAVREYIGSADPPTDDDLLAKLIAAGDNVVTVALAILRLRRADLVNSPLKWDLQGDFTVDNTAQLERLDAAIADLEALEAAATTDPGDVLGAGLLTRSDGRWR